MSDYVMALMDLPRLEMDVIVRGDLGVDSVNEWADVYPLPRKGPRKQVRLTEEEQEAALELLREKGEFDEEAHYDAADAAYDARVGL